jgi:phosphate transport system protein
VIKSHLQRELEKIEHKLHDLSAMAAESVQRAVRAFEERQPALAKDVMDNDMVIDDAEVDIEEDCLKILALYQPVASDLRFIVAVLKMNSDLERIGDLAAHIAERAYFLAQQDPADLPFDFAKMADLVQTMLKESLKALIDQDTALARHVIHQDHHVDQLHRQFYGQAEAIALEDPSLIRLLFPCMTIARHLERIADHATNIAEDVIYLVEGDIMRHQPLNK